MDAFDITNVKSLNNGFVFVWCAQRMQGDYASEVARAKAERVKMLQGFDNRNATEAKAAAQAAIKSVAAQVELVSSLSTSPVMGGFPGSLLTPHAVQCTAPDTNTEW
jgi:hypothetical protein